MAEQVNQEPQKRKRGRPRKTPLAPNEPPKKSPTKQIPLTFKCNSDLEMDLYEHLTSKYYRGAYIKELLIREMFAERPDLATKYGAPTQIIRRDPMLDYTATYNPTTGETTFNDPKPVEPTVVEDDPVDPTDPVIEDQEIEEEPPKVNRGMNTLSMFG